MDNAVALAAIALVGVLVTPLFKLLNNNTRALDHLVKSNKEIAEATRVGNEEAKERNGHLGEQNVQIANLVKSQGKDIGSLKASNQVIADTNKGIANTLSKSALIAAEDRDFLTSSTQVIREQQVEHQTVKSSG